MLVLTIIIGYPVIAAIIRSLFGDTIGDRTHRSSGLANYASALWGQNSAEFWDATGRHLLLHGRDGHSGDGDRVRDGTGHE